MTLELVIAHIPLLLLSALGFWRPAVAAPIFMLVGAIAMFVGLRWFDVYTNDIGLAISMSYIAFGFIAWGLAFRCIFKASRGGNDG